MKNKVFKVIIIIALILIQKEHFCQVDSLTINQNKIIVNPSYYGLQLEALTSIATSELGLQFDFDIISALNNRSNFGFRVSAEYYDYMSLDVLAMALPGPFDELATTSPGPFIDYNLYFLHSLRGENFSFSPFAGLSYHNSLEKESEEPRTIFKWGIEVKYKLYKENIGLIFKFTSSTARGYAGVGIALCF